MTEDEWSRVLRIPRWRFGMTIYYFTGGGKEVAIR
jgi:hypothetical protein